MGYWVKLLYSVKFSLFQIEKTSQCDVLSKYIEISKFKLPCYKGTPPIPNPPFFYKTYVFYVWRPLF